MLPENKLHIILLTYNRAPFLEETLLCKQVVDASERNSSCRNLFYDVYFRVNNKMRFYLLFHKYNRKFNPFYSTPRGVYIRLGKFKTKIIPFFTKKK